MPIVDVDVDGDDDCWSEPLVTSVHIPSSPLVDILAPYEHMATPHPTPTPRPHSTLPVSHPSQTAAIVGSAVGIAIAFVVLAFTARYVIRRRRRATEDPFQDPPKPGFTAIRFGRPGKTPQRRLSDESWVSPVLGSSQYGSVRRKLVPVTTPVCTPTDTEFGSRTEPVPVAVPLVRIPSPVYISPFSPSPSLASSASLSTTSSADPLGPSSPNPARLSRLLSTTFRLTRVAEPPARPSTAHLILTARAYVDNHHPSSTTNASLYTPSVRHQSGTHSRMSFYPGVTVRDAFSTVATTDTNTVCTVPHLARAMDDVQSFTSPFADPGSGETPVGTPLGLKVRLSDASEHARYRAREKEREHERQQEREEQCETRCEFGLRDSESVLVGN